MLVRQTSKWGQILLLSLVGLGATAFTTSWFYRLDEVVTVQGFFHSLAELRLKVVDWSTVKL